jgi:two-component system nitrate/nitrite response regulator NarL
MGTLGTPVEPSRATPALSPRLREVLSLVADGRTTAEIAETLGISPHTVKNYLERIYERLGARDRVQAVSRALRAGLLE